MGGGGGDNGDDARLLPRLETQTAERDMMDTFEKSLPTPPRLPPLYNPRKAERGRLNDLARCDDVATFDYTGSASGSRMKYDSSYSKR